MTSEQANSLFDRALRKWPKMEETSREFWITPMLPLVYADVERFFLEWPSEKRRPSLDDMRKKVKPPPLPRSEGCAACRGTGAISVTLVKVLEENLDERYYENQGDFACRCSCPAGQPFRGLPLVEDMVRSARQKGMEVHVDPTPSTRQQGMRKVAPLADGLTAQAGPHGRKSGYGANSAPSPLAPSVKEALKQFDREGVGSDADWG